MLEEEELPDLTDCRRITVSDSRVSPASRATLPPPAKRPLLLAPVGAPKRVTFATNPLREDHPDSLRRVTSSRQAQEDPTPVGEACQTIRNTIRNMRESGRIAGRREGEKGRKTPQLEYQRRKTEAAPETAEEEGDQSREEQRHYSRRREARPSIDDLVAELEDDADFSGRCREVVEYNRRPGRTEASINESGTVGTSSMDESRTSDRAGRRDTTSQLDAEAVNFLDSVCDAAQDFIDGLPETW